jgi:hypothetical protein
MIRPDGDIVVGKLGEAGELAKRIKPVVEDVDLHVT